MKSSRPCPATTLFGSNPVLDRHRNLFNADTCTFFYNPELFQAEDFTLKREVDPRPVKLKRKALPSGGPNNLLLPVGGPFAPKAIHRYVDTLADNGIDTFLVNANASRAWYPSKVIPTILDGYQRGDREYFRGHAICQGVTSPPDVEKFIDRIMSFMNLYQDLIDAGVDWLAEAAKACRRRQISPWVTIRMNDFHGHRNIDGSFFNVPLLKNPAMRLKHSTYSPNMADPSYRTGLNYERREVRTLMFTQIKEVVEDYDYEGLELDWLRNALCCEPNASAKTVEMMSDWLREVRVLTERRAKKTGRPYPLGLRIPGQLETLKSIGLDVATLCREGTLDFISPSGFWRTTWDMPHDDLRRQVGGQTAIYGVIEDGANALRTRSPKLNVTREIRFISASQEMLYANAAGKLVLGADGIEWFNFYCTDSVRIPGLRSRYEFMRDIHRLDFLRGKEKHYTVADRGGILEHPPFERPAQVPTTLEPKWRQTFRIPMCAEPGKLKLVIQVVLKKDGPVTALPVSINACWPKIKMKQADRLLFPCGPLTHHVKDHVGFNFVFPISLVKDGWNEVVVENGGDRPITLVCIELAVMATPTN